MTEPLLTSRLLKYVSQVAYARLHAQMLGQAMIQRDQLELLLAAVAGAGLVRHTHLGTRRRSRCQRGGVFLLVPSSSLAPMPSSPRRSALH